MDKIRKIKFFYDFVNLTNKLKKSLFLRCMCVLSTFFFAKNIIKILLKVTILNFRLKNKYGNEWIIITSGCSQEVIGICLNFLSVNHSYKFVLVGSNEKTLIQNIEEIKKIHPNSVLEFCLYNYGEYHIQELKYKLSYIFNKFHVKHISVIVLNSDFQIRKYFDEINQSDIKKMMNYLRNDIAIASIINDYKVKDKRFRTLVLSKENRLSVIPLPTMQIYYSIKSMIDEYYLNLSASGYDYYCCLESGCYLPIKLFDARFKLINHSRSFYVNLTDYFRYKMMSMSKSYKLSYYQKHLLSPYTIEG